MTQSTTPGRPPRATDPTVVVPGTRDPALTDPGRIGPDVILAALVIALASIASVRERRVVTIAADGSLA